MKKKIALLMACVMAFGVAVGGTLAWLTDTTDDVVNTFTTSDINITLEEGDDLDLKMIPGHTIEKDPVATVLGGSEDCYLFVKVTEGGDFAEYMEYDIATGWTALDGQAGVYYREVASSDEDQAFAILADDQVTVKGTVDKADMATAKTTAPTLTFKAYASQMYESANNPFTPAEAWNNIGG